MKVTQFDDLYPANLSIGGTLLIASDGSNSATTGGDIDGGPGDYSVTRLRSTVSLGSNLSTGVAVGDVLTIVQASPAVALFAVPSNSGSSFGSNATRVSATSAVGASSASAREDHIHDGIGTITASSSNTMARGTLNLRPGTNVSFGLTDADSDGALDTITVNASATGGAGGGAPTNAKYVTTETNASLSAEIVIPGLAVVDRMPASPSAYDDEFDALSGWTTAGSLATSNVTDFASHWHAANTSAANEIDGVYKACPSTPFTVTMRISAMYLSGNYGSIGLLLAESSPGKYWTFEYMKHTTYPYGAQRQTWTNRTTSSVATLVDALGPLNTVYLRMVVNSATSVDCYFSPNGMLWTQPFSAIDPGLTPANVGICAIAYAGGGGLAEAVIDWIRFT